ncbi:MAG: hypothetical protein ACI857_001979 [Arenicella sp.]|jgi:hypothetical protein
MKNLIFIACLFFASTSYSQEHTYVFKLQGVTNNVLAKQAISDMREILHIRVFYFDETSDQFRTSTHLVYNWQDMAEDLNLHNYFIEGEIIHLVNE